MTGTRATTIRVLRQLRHDPRTVVLLLVVPAALMTIFRFVYDRQRLAFEVAGPALMVIFPLFTMFLVSSVAVLRERTTGTLERLMTTPLGRLPLLAGYGIAFTLLAIIQAGVISAVSLRAGRAGRRSRGPRDRRRVRRSGDRARCSDPAAPHGLMSGRRAGPNRTRQEILDAARAAFAGTGYDATSVRSVARAAGVDPSLVLHFFSNKPGLFAAAAELPVDPEAFVTGLLNGGRSTLGPRLIRAVVELWDAPGVFEPFQALIRGAVSHEDAARLLREFVTTEILGRLAVAAAPDHPQARAALAGSQIIGLAMARKVVQVEPLASATPEWLASALGPTIQHYLTGPLETPTPP